MSLHLEVSRQREARFEAAVRQNGTDPETLFERMLDSYLPKTMESEPSPFSGRSLADIVLEIGGVEGLPSDMSENPESI